MRRSWFLVPLLLLAGCGEAPPRKEPLDPEIAARIHDLVDGTDREKRAAAHDDLRTRGSVVVEPLAEALDREDVDASVGAWIAEVLGSLGAAAAPAAPALFRRLMQGGECSATTSWALAQVGEVGVPYLGRALSSPHPPTRLWAADALASLGEKAAPVSEELWAVLDDPVDDVRMNALHALAELPSAGLRGRPKLLALTRDASADVRLGAARLLAAEAGRDALVQERLRGMILDEAEDEDYVRAPLLEALGPHLGRDEEALSFLRRLLDLPGDEGGVRSRARVMLLRRGVDDPALVASVADFGSGEAFARVLERADALGRSGPNGRRASLPLLHRVLTWSSEEADRVRAARMLGGLGPAAAGDDATMRLLEEHAAEGKEEPAVSAACEAAFQRLGGTRKRPPAAGEVPAPGR